MNYLRPIINFCVLYSLLLLSGCFKTAEQIQREKKVDSMTDRQEQSAKLVAELTQRVQALQNQLGATTGQLQEKDYEQNKQREEKMQAMQSTIDQLQAQVEALNAKVRDQQKSIHQIEKQIKKQKKYIKKVNSTLTDIDQGGLQSAHKLFEKGKSSQAIAAYEGVLAENKISAAQKNHVYYNLGLLNYRKKKYDDALSYFSKIYTKYPKSSWAPRALLFIAHSLDKKGLKAEAKAAYKKVLKEYPKSRQARKAKKELK